MPEDPLEFDSSRLGIIRISFASSRRLTANLLTTRLYDIRVIVTVLLPASLLVVRTTQTLNEATSPGLAKPPKVVVPALPGNHRLRIRELLLHKLKHETRNYGNVISATALYGLCGVPLGPVVPKARMRTWTTEPEENAPNCKVGLPGEPTMTKPASVPINCFSTS